MKLRALDRKLLRDLNGMRGQAIAIAFVVLAGVTTWVAMRNVMVALDRSLENYYRDYRFADAFAGVRRAPESVRGRLREIPGIAHVETRVTAPVNLEVPDFDEPVSGLLVSVPPDAQPDLNRLVVRQGRLARAADEVLLNESFAEAHALGPGDTIHGVVNGRRRALAVVGVALSPEHLMQIQPGGMFPDPERYGVLWMARPALAAAYDMEGAFNDVAFALAPGTALDDVLAHVDRVLERYGGPGAYGREDQPSHFLITEELKQLASTSTMLPVVFLLVAAFLLNIVVTRLIGLQREQIGVLKAFGYSDRAVAWHYAKLVLVMALAGAAAGVALGLWLGSVLGELYLDSYRFPSLDYRPYPGIVLTGVLLTVAAALLGVYRAMRRAARLSPAVAMRAAAPPTYRTTLVERLGIQRWFDQPTRMILRNLERQPLRALLTIVGIASSCAILIMGLFFRDAVGFMMHVQYDLAQTEDMSVAFIQPTSMKALHELAALPGVRYVEPMRTVAVRLRHGHREHDTAIEGVPFEPRLRRLFDRDLEPIVIPAGGIVLSERLGEILGAGAGDTIVVEVREGERRVRDVPVAALAQQFVGVGAYMDFGSLNRMAGAGRALSGATLLTDERRTVELEHALRERPGVASIATRERVIQAFHESTDRAMLTVTFILSALAAVIAFGVVYNSARIALSERDRELASLRVLGMTRGEVSYILLGELALLTLLAVPVGLLLGIVSAHGVAAGTQTDLYQFPVIIERATFGLAAAIVIGASLLSGLIVHAKLRRLDLIGVLKTRE